MTINAENIGKKFGKNWIFRNLNVEVSTGDFIALTGPNGSGKSTLLQILSGYLSPSEGRLLHDGENPDPDKFKLISFSSPYIELPEEMTFEEFLRFHSTFRVQRISTAEICQRSQLPGDKQITDFSTGMKQRAQLCTAFYFQNDAVFMDEPTSNLDEQGFEWWKKELDERDKSAPLVLASNQLKEIMLSTSSISL
ncbi:MAG: ATP-binding cassette domain-containing protein [Cyclobacteriaceae bacterium]